MRAPGSLEAPRWASLGHSPSSFNCAHSPFFDSLSAVFASLRRRRNWPVNGALACYHSVVPGITSDSSICHCFSFAFSVGTAVLTVHRLLLTVTPFVAIWWPLMAVPIITCEDSSLRRLVIQTLAVDRLNCRQTKHLCFSYTH